MTLAQTIDHEQLAAPAAADWLVGGGEMGARIRAFDWSRTPLGPVEHWPQSLRSAVSILLPSRAQIALFWGDDLITLYNDAYRPVFGGKHPSALGQPIRLAWDELWRAGLKELFDGVIRTGEAFWARDRPFFMERHGYLEETFFDVSYDPVRDESGRVGGVFCIVSETTARVIGERRLSTLRELGRHAGESRTVRDVLTRARDVLAGNPHDLPFVLICDEHGRPAEQSGVRADGWNAGAPGERLLEGAADLAPLGALPGGPWPESPQRAVQLPIATPGRPPFGTLVAGVSPRLVLDEAYRDFLRMLAAAIAGAANAARTLEEERARARALAEVDRAKTAFFSNVSHEFRTPLTLMLGPLEDLLQDPALPAPTREPLELMRRNGRRLLKLVNALLDFARIEAGRADAQFQPVDLAALTAELASNFRSACERAGLALEVDCPPLAAPVWVDPGLYEKIVLNLISNALKFTHQGSIRVRVFERDRGVAVSVSDTGIGIAAEELNRVFERFHRVEDAHGRTHEGSGIGLALVRELARLHGAEVTAESQPGRGATFTLALRYGSGHLPQDRLRRDSSPRASAAAAAYVDETLGWMDTAAAPATPPDAAPRGRVLVVDDNADMRQYLVRLLGSHWRVRAAPDGAAALAALEQKPFDVVVSDVMMPGLDGFALLRAIRARPALSDVRVVLVSARAGEEARAEGIGAGADDYVVKPFSGAQLVAQVRAQLALQAARRERAALLAREQSAQREATLQREHLVRLFTQAPYPIAILRGPRHVIELANDPACAAWGRTPAQCLGRPLLEVLPELRDQAFPALLDRVLATGIPYEGKEMPVRLTLPGGERRVHFNFVYTPLLGRDGSAEGVMVSAFDVSDEVAARHELQRLRHEAEAASRTKDEFLAMLSHELRNPLAPIVSALRLMRLRGQRSVELDILERQATHLTRLVDDLLDVSRITRRKVELRRETLEVADVLHKALEIANPLLEERRHRVDFTRVERRGLLVDADSARLAQVFANLLTNAAKYSDPESLITLTARRRDDWVRVEVTDEGVGIAPEMTGQIFDPFVQQPQTLARARGGLGLGLAIVRSLVELHGGSTSVRSAGAGQGSTFVVELPRAARPPAKAAPRPPVVEAPRRGGRHILVVDDNRDAALTLAELLRCMGHTVEVAHDGAGAVARATGRSPDLAFIDIGLPDMDGYEVARRLRAAGHRRPRLIAVTGYGLEADRARSAQAGFDSHLVKPVELSRLAPLLDRREPAGPGSTEPPAGI